MWRQISGPLLLVTIGALLQNELEFSAASPVSVNDSTHNNAVVTTTQDEQENKHALIIKELMAKVDFAVYEKCDTDSLTSVLDVLPIDNAYMASLNLHQSVNLNIVLSATIMHMSKMPYKSFLLYEGQGKFNKEKFLAKQIINVYGSHAKSELLLRYKEIEKLTNNQPTERDAELLNDDIELLLDWMAVAALDRLLKNVLDQYQLFEIANFLQYQYEHQKKKNLVKKWMKKYSLMVYDSLTYQLSIDRIMKSIGKCLSNSKTASCQAFIRNAGVVWWDGQIQLKTSDTKRIAKHNFLVQLIFNEIGLLMHHQNQITEQSEWFARLYILAAKAEHIQNLTPETARFINKPGTQAGLKLLEGTIVNEPTPEVGNKLDAELKFALSLWHLYRNLNTSKDESLASLKKLLPAIKEFDAKIFIEPVLQEIIHIIATTLKADEIIAENSEMFTRFENTRQHMLNIYENYPEDETHFIQSCVDSVYVKLNNERNDAIKLYLLTVHNADRPLQDTIYDLTEHTYAYVSPLAISKIMALDKALADAKPLSTTKEIMHLEELVRKHQIPFKNKKYVEIVENVADNAEIATQLFVIQDLFVRHSDIKIGEKLGAKLDEHLTKLTADVAKLFEIGERVSFSIQNGFAVLGDYLANRKIDLIKIDPKYKGLCGFIKDCQRNSAINRELNEEVRNQRKMRQGSLEDDIDLTIPFTYAMREIFRFQLPVDVTQTSEIDQFRANKLRAIKKFYILIINTNAMFKVFRHAELSLAVGMQVLTTHSFLSELFKKNGKSGQLRILSECSEVQAGIKRIERQNSMQPRSISDEPKKFRFAGNPIDYKKANQNDQTIALLLFKIHDLFLNAGVAKVRSEDLHQAAKELTSALQTSEEDLMHIYVGIQIGLYDLGDHFNKHLDYTMDDIKKLPEFLVRAKWNKDFMEGVYAEHFNGTTLDDLYKRYIKQIYLNAPPTNEDIKRVYLIGTELESYKICNFVKADLYIIDGVIKLFAQKSDEWLWMRLKDPFFAYEMDHDTRFHLTPGGWKQLPDDIETLHNDIKTKRNEQESCYRVGMVYTRLKAGISAERVTPVEHFKEHTGLLEKLIDIELNFVDSCKDHYPEFSLNNEFRREIMHSVKDGIGTVEMKGIHAKAERVNHQLQEVLDKSQATINQLNDYLAENHVKLTALFNLDFAALEPMQEMAKVSSSLETAFKSITAV